MYDDRFYSEYTLPVNDDKDFAPPPTGWHASVCTMVIDLGMQPGFQGGSPQHKFMLYWELDKAREDGKPHWVAQRYTASMNPKSNLRKIVEQWYGRPLTNQEVARFSPFSLAGKSCFLSISHRPKESGGVRAVVQGIGPLPNGMAAPPLEPWQVIRYRFDEGLNGNYDSLPSWVHKILADGEKPVRPDQRAHPVTADGDVPF